MNEPDEFQKYIESSLLSISNSVKNSGFKISDPIEFNLAITNTNEGTGGFKIYVAKAEGKLKSEEISHIKFKVHPDVKPNGVFISNYDPNPAI
jgi:hypothetical protein